MSDLIFGLFCGVLLAIASWGVTNDCWKRDTVDRGFAIYCPTDGQWAWNGECDE